jgi:7,8-dihydroneopterin aldolase/epimerase/oxygenase
MSETSKTTATEISRAFAHPLERSEATAPGLPDRISLSDYEVGVEIGAFQVERDLIQKLRFNVVVEVADATAPLGDDVDNILSYDTIREAIDHELAAERLNLLETLADRIAARILAEPQADRVFLRIEKLDRGPFKLGVEIVRAGAAVPSQAPAAPVSAGPRPHVVHLCNQAITSDLLPGWLAQLAGAGDADNTGQCAVVLTVAAPDLTRPQAGGAAQRHIDLLAIEQNAWTLAARAPHCVVAGTRTELDWAMKNGQMVIWAPAKFVLDTVGNPAPDARDALALTLWFAQEMNAVKTTVVDADTAGKPNPF